jgi:hypothetical protein
LNRHLSDRQSDALPLSYRSGGGKRPRCGRLPNVVRPPATRRKARTSAARRYPIFLHTRAWLRISHDMYYPLPLTTDDASDSHRFAAIPDVSRTREAGLAWNDRVRCLGETHRCAPFPPLPTVSSARPLDMASADPRRAAPTDGFAKRMPPAGRAQRVNPIAMNLVEDRGFEPRASALQRRRSSN